jgi:hypothetical protein
VGCATGGPCTAGGVCLLMQLVATRCNSSPVSCWCCLCLDLYQVLYCILDTAGVVCVLIHIYIYI